LNFKLLWGIHYIMVYYYSVMIENLSKATLLGNLKRMDLNQMSAYLRGHFTKEPIYLIGDSFCARNKNNHNMTLTRYADKWQLTRSDNNSISEYGHHPDYHSSVSLLDLVEHIKAFFAN
jgi:hypothetical protein